MIIIMVILCNIKMWSRSCADMLLTVDWSSPLMDVNSHWPQFITICITHDVLPLKPQTHTDYEHLSNIWTKSADETMDLSLDVWSTRSHSADTAPSIWQQAMPPDFIVQYHTLFLTWHPPIASLPILSSPLSGGFCHAASTTSPPFCLIEIQLGTQTMPISWHQILERTAQRNQSQSFPSQSSPVSRRSSWTNANLFWVSFLSFRLLNSLFTALISLTTRVCWISCRFLRQDARGISV